MITEKNKYNEYQLKQIRFGLEDGLNVSFYADPKFSWKQMEQVRLGLEYGLAAWLYAKTKFSWKQMERKRKKMYVEQKL